MDDMFAVGGGHEEDEDEDDPAGNGRAEHVDADYYDDDEPIDGYPPRACDRYKPTDETVSSEDEMEILNMDEVEMIEDLGSLAQSLGASHLGRSLQLQAEMTGRPSHKHNKNNNNTMQHGLQVGGAPSAAPMGGLGSAMMAAAASAGADVPAVAPMAPPRLDSFKMIKVIGKGSFGKSFVIAAFCVVTFSGELFLWLLPC